MLAVLIGVYIAASYVILRQVIVPAFDELELSAAKSDLKRAEMALRTDLDNLQATTADWAPWDDIYDYVLGKNPGFQRSNLTRPTLVNLGLDFMAVYAFDDHLMWAQLLVDGTEVPIAELEILSPGDAAAPLLTSHGSASEWTGGFVATGLGPAMVSSRPILKSDDSGPPAGAVVMGQFLNDSRLARLRDRTDVDMRWDFAAEPNAAGGAADGEAGSARFEVQVSGISGRKLLADIHGNSFLSLRSNTPRSISSLGGRTVNAALLFLAISGFLVMVSVWVMLRVMILKPIEGLAGHMTKISQSGDLSQRMDVQRNDELGALASQFDNLTSEVHDARQALLDQSFKAGKADTAAEVLHNIRNAMTPMINGIERLGKALNASGNLRVEDATNEISDPTCPPDRREKLLQYIDASFKHIKAVSDDAEDDLNIATAQARQIEGILADQEKFANVAPVSEVLTIAEVLGEAVNVIPKNAQPAVNVEFPRELASYSIKAHRIGLLQVLSNLVLNAYESIQRCKSADGRIRFEAAAENLEEQSMVRLTIRDNGGGFNQNIRERIFQRGFTSKTEGETTGLGLHWCANAVAGMGGRIQAESRGLGQGAVFHVLLPAAQGG
jgi:sensor domain CHASE-containing protein